MTITPVYAGLLALIFVLLSLRVISGRRSTGTALGDGDDRLLLRRLRAHGNFAEYAPLAIVLMALIEWQEAPGLLLHAIGACLLVGRLLHAFGVSQEPETYKLRVTGMALTFTALIIGALANLALASFSLAPPA
ncbi:MAG: MAPEG family protein [Pseudomonadota bacterium]